MDPKTAQILLGAAGSGGAEPGLYVDEVFSTYLYDGTGATQTITNGIDLSGEGGMVWLKNRTGAYNHNLYDTERGVKKALYPNRTNSEYTENSSIGTFNDDGFTFPVKVGYEPFTLEIIASENKMEVILNETYSRVYQGNSITKWGVFKNYFKAGNYLSTTDKNAFSRVKYYSLEVIH